MLNTQSPWGALGSPERNNLGCCSAPTQAVLEALQEQLHTLLAHAPLSCGMDVMG